MKNALSVQVILKTLSMCCAYIFRIEYTHMNISALFSALANIFLEKLSTFLKPQFVYQNQEIFYI